MNPKKQESTTDARSNPELKNITLHHRIREAGHPNAKEINKRYAEFLANPDDVTSDDIKAYKSLVTEASRLEIKKAEIILCTCVTAAAHKFENASNFRQVNCH